MDGIVTMLLQALPVLGAAGGSELSKRAVGELWDRAKQLVQRRFGAAHPAPQWIDQLRSAADDPAERETVSAKLSQLDLDSYPEISMLARELAAALDRAGAKPGVLIQASKISGVVGTNLGHVTMNIGDKD